MSRPAIAVRYGSFQRGQRWFSGEHTRQEGCLLLTDVFVLLSGKGIGNGPEFGDVMRYLASDGSAGSLVAVTGCERGIITSTMAFLHACSTAVLAFSASTSTAYNHVMTSPYRVYNHPVSLPGTPTIPRRTAHSRSGGCCGAGAPTNHPTPDTSVPIAASRS